MKAKERIMYIVEGSRQEFFELMLKLPDRALTHYHEKFKSIICSDPFVGQVAFGQEEWKYLMGLTGSGTLMTEEVSDENRENV